MGGDGGTISSSRLYLRGAGKASHTADHPSNAHKRTKVEDAERARLVLSTCAISGGALDLSPAKRSRSGGKSNANGGNGGESGAVSSADIVVCPYGKLYKREKVLEALLQRSQMSSSSELSPNVQSLGSHIRGMKDLHPVRFHVIESTEGGGMEIRLGAISTTLPCVPLRDPKLGAGMSPRL